MSKTTIEFKKIFRLPLSMCISLVLVDLFIGASVTRIFGIIIYRIILILNRIIRILSWFTEKTGYGFSG
ncbi:MAG: hypothetical protein WA144_05650 [Candidatus Methanoperedens sp.]